MDKVEASGRTLEEAVQAAAAQLEVGVDALEYEIVEEGAKGFLGLGQTPTTIEAWISEGYTPSLAEPETATWETPAEEETTEEAEEEVAEEGAEEAEEEVRPEPVAAVVEQPVEKPVAAPAEQPAAEPTAEGDALVENAIRVLGEVLKAMDVQASPVLKSASDEEVIIELVGEDVAILIGRHGQTLDALQYLIGIIANRAPHARRRVILDAEGYRERYKQALEKKALDYARAVKEEGKEAVLEPQSARDRRIIHVALADHPDVYTYSEGEGDDRHVVISPRK